MSIRRSITALTFLALAFTASSMATNTAVSNERISGIWVYKTDERKDGVPLGSLSLHLNVRDGEVTGKYCYIWNFGRKIDCPDEDEQNVRGTFSSDLNSGAIKITSTYSDEKFAASLRLIGETLHFQTSADPRSDRLFIPGNVRLHRKVQH